MTNNSVLDVVLACENASNPFLLKAVDSILTKKLVEGIERKRKEVGRTLFENSESIGEEWVDTYENYEPKIQEAIDYVVESILESGLELKNTIAMASKQYNVKEESLAEYFATVVEAAEVDSTSSDDEDSKRGMPDDMDTNKRVRYEQAQFKLDDGSTIMLPESTWIEVNQVLENLSEENQVKFVSLLKRDRTSFNKMVGFCHKVVIN